MNADRPNSSNAAQDSDDLIAELARLVAQDARTTSSKSDEYTRAEPRFEPEPQEQPQAYEPAEETQWAEDEQAQEQPEPVAAYADRYEPESFEPVSDEYPAQSEPTQPVEDFDPIAGLIADAEVESYERDTSEEDWGPEEPAAFQPQAAPVGNFDDRQFAVYHEPEAAGHDQSDNDPLSEIEALIGEAGQNADGLQSGRRVRSSFLDDEPTSSAVDAAETAILAAAAATGGAMRHNQPVSEPSFSAEPMDEFEPVPEADESNAYESIPDPLFATPSRPVAAERQDYDEFEEDGEYIGEPEESRLTTVRRRLGGFVIPVAAGVAILALLGGTYFVFFSGPQAPTEAPVLTADASPLKEEGAPPAENENSSVVFNEIEGNTAVVEDEALLSRDQTGGATGRDVASVVGVEEGEMALANRPVRTVTVRPDGTIVPAEDSVAGSNVLPVDRPDVPAVPNSTLTSDPIGAAIAEAMAGGEISAAEPTSTLSLPGTTAASDADAVGADGSVNDAAATASPDAASGQTGNAPVPVPRPSNIGNTSAAPAAIAAAPTETASLASIEPAAAATPTAQPAQAGATPAAWVQLSSQRAEDAAQADIAGLNTRYGSLFNGATPEVNRVDLGERGVYYRVRLPQPSFAQANSVCSAIQAQGGDCFVLNN